LGVIFDPCTMPDATLTVNVGGELVNLQSLVELFHKEIVRLHAVHMLS